MIFPDRATVLMKLLTQKGLITDQEFRELYAQETCKLNKIQPFKPSEYGSEHGHQRPLSSQVMNSVIQAGNAPAALKNARGEEFGEMPPNLRKLIQAQLEQCTPGYESCARPRTCSSPDISALEDPELFNLVSKREGTI